MGVAGDIDQEVTEQPVDQPWTWCLAVTRLRHQTKRDFELMQHVLPRFIDSGRLTCRPDEQAGEQIGQRRTMLPVEHQTLEQIGPAQERAIGRLRATEDDVVAAAGAGVPAIDHELVGAEARKVRLFIE
jgi:hypothetical protein